MGSIVENKKPWQEIASQKQAERESKIPQAWRLSKTYPMGSNVVDVPITCGILTPEEIKITSTYDALDLLDLLKSGRYSVEAVTIAFCKRAAIAQQLVNCLTEIFFDQAIERARFLDAQRKADPEAPIGALFGLPISLKDSFFLPGMDASIGFIAYANKPCNSMAVLPQILLEEGAVLFCKTNIPQTMMTADSDNNVWGRTLNPYNTLHTAGGSSGGEGALVAMRGSLIGVGTDIGGSIRIPAHACGVYGFKPSTGIIPFAGQQTPVDPGTPIYAPAAGPLATSVRACRYFLETVMKAAPWTLDADCYRIPWTGTSPAVGNRKLRIGVVRDDGMFTPTPPIRRVLEESAQKLKAAGHTLVPLELPILPELLKAAHNHFAIDGLKYTMNIINSAGEPLVPSVQNTGFFKSDPEVMSIEQFERLHEKRHEHGQIYNDLWRNQNLDIIISPLMTGPAPLHDKLRIRNFNYTMVWNYLDYPALCLPVGHVGPADLKDAGAKYGTLDEQNYDLYTGPEAYAGLPLSVQLISSKQNDENFIQSAEYLHGIIKGRESL